MMHNHQQHAIMNWELEKINDYDNATIVEEQTRSRRLNCYTLFMKNCKHDLSRLSPAERLQWQRDNPPHSLPNVHALSNNQIIILRRRVNRSTNSTTLISAFTMLKNLHNGLSNEALVAWKNRSHHLNQREEHVDVPMDDNVLNICQSETQLKILTISWLNLEKMLCLKLQRSNRHINESGSGELRDKCISLPLKMKLKRQMLFKMNMDLSLMFYLFGPDQQLKILNQKLGSLLTINRM